MTARRVRTLDDLPPGPLQANAFAEAMRLLFRDGEGIALVVADIEPDAYWTMAADAAREQFGPDAVAWDFDA